MNRGGPVVSVLMTAYNREPYIAAAIESVLAQRFADFELLVVDDASTDETVSIANAYAARDPRVRVVVNQRNLGDYPNRNHAVTFARGEFFKYHDSDDVMYPHCLDVMVSAMRAEPRADFALTSAHGWAGGPLPTLLTPRECYEREYFGTGLFHLGPACAMFRRRSFERLGPFETRGPSSDFHFWVRACRTAHVLLVPGDLFWYRVHDEQEGRRGVAFRQQAESDGHAFQALFHPDCPLAGDSLERARRRRLSALTRRAVRDVRRGQLRQAIWRIRSAGATRRQWCAVIAGGRVSPSTASGDRPAVPVR